MLRLLRSRTAAPPTRGWRLSLSLWIAAIIAAAFAIGFLHGRNGDRGEQAAATLRLAGTASAPRAAGSLRIGRADASGNRPVLLTVRQLPTLAPDQYYDLYLRRGRRRPPAWVGVFTTRNGSASVHLNAALDPTVTAGWEVATGRRGGVGPERVVLVSRFR